MFSRKIQYWDSLTIPPQKVKQLAIHRIDLSACADRLTEFTRLRLLSVGWSLDTELPTQILQMSSLRELIILNLPLCTWPDFTRLTKLRRLTLRGTNIAEVPSEVSMLRALRSLDLGNNRYVSLPEELGDLPLLRDLSVSDNQISTLPKSLGKAHALRNVNLVGTNFRHSQDRVDAIRRNLSPKVSITV